MAIRVRAPGVVGVRAQPPAAHPASTTHRQLTEAELGTARRHTRYGPAVGRRGAIGDNLADLHQALTASAG